MVTRGAGASKKCKFLVTSFLNGLSDDNHLKQVFSDIDFGLPFEFQNISAGTIPLKLILLICWTESINFFNV